MHITHHVGKFTPSQSVKMNVSYVESLAATEAKEEETPHGTHEKPEDPGASLLGKLETEKYEYKILLIAFVEIVTLTLVIFKEVPWLRSLALKIPQSVLLIGLGIGIGGLFDFSDSLHPVLKEADARTFFDILLPPIILEAAYQLYSSQFVFNLDGILVLALVGTTLNIFTIGVCLWLTYSKLLENSEFTLLHMLLLSSIVSAVDPVAVLGVFDQLGVQRALYILIFGESLLNDGVTVVIFDTLEKIAFTTVKPSTYGFAVLSFIPIAFGGSLIGIIYGLFSSIACKYASELSGILQPTLILTTAYMAFLNAQLFHWSGILALIACGLTQKRYAFFNLFEESRLTVEYGIGVLASISEAIIFLILGIKLLDKNVEWDWHLNLLTLLFCIVCRLIYTFLLGYCVNRNRLHKLSNRHMIMIWYGGLRGAVSFAMAASLHEESINQRYMGATLFVILTTVAAMGVTIQPLVHYFQFLEKPHVDNFTSTAVSRINFNVLAGMEAILGGGGSSIHYWLEKIQRWDIKHVQPIMCKKGAKTKSFKELIKSMRSTPKGCGSHDEATLECRDCVRKVVPKPIKGPKTKRQKIEDVDTFKAALVKRETYREKDEKEYGPDDGDLLKTRERRHTYIPSAHETILS